MTTTELQDEIAEMYLMPLERRLRELKLGCNLTLVARHEQADGEKDVVVTNDDLGKAIAALQRRAKAA